MIDLRSLLPTELARALAPLQVPGYRVTQIFGWLQQKGVRGADDMTSLPKDLRTKLAQDFLITRCEVVRKQTAEDGTVKYLFALYDGETVESVVMRYEYGHSICVSTQVGCKMGCAFCASGQNGFVRQLLPGEIIAQIHAAQSDLGVRASHAVLMGMGEPLDNYNNV
ncbi:MAG: 23S rRNA (adenine(2503)-C(2))-methyltransferase RlmN, partial [Oscillospiraceae bacterium]|nr:23S rRNA (adenine(2503)-C(2))-methyltransferase RlmN [Oscillospiraceae bacterium]